MQSPRLVLSLFAGIGSLDEGFRRAGFCVVSAGDVAWSSLFDVRNFHAPRGIFDGVIGGDPCQEHSALANLVRAKGLKPTFPDMTPELERVIGEAKPRWFLRENVPGAPDVKPDGYAVASFLLDHSTMDSGDGIGHEQMRRRRFWFGVWGQERAPELRAHIDFATFILPEGDGEPKAPQRRKSLCGDRRESFIPGGQAEVDEIRRGRQKSVTARHTSATMGGESTPGWSGNNSGKPPRYSLDEMADLQGLPRDLLEHSPMTMVGKRKLIGNAVPLPMAAALGRAVKSAMRIRAARREP